MRLAESYKGYSFDETKAYNKGGKLYVHATCKCDRCVKGVYVCRIENGHPVPHPNAQGVCFKCGGTGYVNIEARLYTDKEFESMQKRNAAAAEKREKERKARDLAEYDSKKAKWLRDNGFNEEGFTYIYFPSDSFSIKDQLKEVGFRFNNILLWHTNIRIESYADKVIEVYYEDVATFSPIGTGFYRDEAKNFITSKIKEQLPEEKPSEWVGNEKDKIIDYPVVLTFMKGMESKFGWTTLVKFEDENGSELDWWTSTFVDFEIGDKVYLSGTIKKLDEYNGKHITTMTRCKLKGV